jgi:hypothetical protein
MTALDLARRRPAPAAEEARPAVPPLPSGPAADEVR